MDEKLEAERLTAQQNPPFGLARAGGSVAPVSAGTLEKTGEVLKGAGRGIRNVFTGKRE